ncbi:MAG: hypothetical protein DCF15_19045 [Phormidesmis priestleyi]|uniref:Uncharacterized protein n=1 Tax=Phormidesmis priestleyi TaxID=268141 RepID=A0A2W4YJY2_9CYAN|nr:MAG: hypothetical protein DCF15_19045 [Phormidesmis priestleyi]
METTEAVRKALKHDILDHFRQEGLSEYLWTKALDAIKNAAYSACPVDSNVRSQYGDFFSVVSLKDGENFYYKLTWSFSGKHYLALAGFVKRYEALLGQEAVEVSAAKASVEDDLEGQRRDYFFDQYESGALGEVIVYSDRVEVCSFEYREDFSRTLPKGGRYEGKGTWVYPASMRERFGNGRGSFWDDFPVLYAD